MLLLAEGSDGESFNQFKNTLHLPDESAFQYMRSQYPEFRQQLMVNISTVELDVNQAIFADSNRHVHPEYLNLIHRFYGVDYVPITSLSSTEAANTINNYIQEKTHGKIKNVVKPGDLNDLRLMLTSTIFFKGQWTVCQNNLLRFHYRKELSRFFFFLFLDPIRYSQNNAATILWREWSIYRRCANDVSAKCFPICQYTGIKRKHS